MASKWNGTPFAEYRLPDDADTLVSKELLQLSLKDRNAIDEEIHGVSTLAPEESPEFLEKALRDLSLEVDRIPNESACKAAYLESQKFPTTYVNGSDFRLRFLRCELFDAPKAAMRMMKFLGVVSDLFGTVVLQRPITFMDFSKDEEKLYRKGYIQVLPYRDRAGRVICAWVGDFGLSVGLRQRAKLSIYMFYAVSDDVESQRKGLVIVGWVGSNTFGDSVPSLQHVDLFAKVWEGCPIRIVSSHMCFPDKPYFHWLRYLYTLTLSANKRQRARFHLGEEIELRYEIKSYGIPVEIIPVTGTGNIKTVHHKQWIRLRKHLEDVRARGLDGSSIIELPGSTDVIFRTGTSLTCHPGNSMFQNFIESYMLEHSAASQAGKTAITKKIIDTLRRSGGRFLQWDNRGWWTELTGESQIHTKVAVSVRDFKSKSIAQQNLQTSRSSTTIFQNQDGKRRKLSYESDSPDCNCAVCDSMAMEKPERGML